MATILTDAPSHADVGRVRSVHRAERDCKSASSAFTLRRDKKATPASDGACPNETADSYEVRSNYPS